MENQNKEFDFFEYFKQQAELHRKEREEAEKPLNDFVCGENGFVNPEKMEAVQQFGLEKAKELWANGEPSWGIRTKFQEANLNRVLNGPRKVKVHFADGSSEMRNMY